MTRKLPLLAVVLTIAGSSIAKDMQIVFVDSFKAMRECKDGQLVGKELDDMRDAFSKEIQAEAQKIANMEKDLKSQASMLKADVLNKKTREIDRMKRDLEDSVREKEESIKVAMQQKTEALAMKVEESIVTVAKSKDVDAVIDKMTGRVMYTKEDNKGDITNEAIAAVDKKGITVASTKAPEKKPTA